MVKELSYSTTSHVMESWEQVRRTKNYEEVAGAVLFQRYVCFDQTGIGHRFSIIVPVLRSTKTLTNPFVFPLCRLFEKCPPAKVLFGFPIDIDPTTPEVLTSKRFLMHAAYLIQMIDTALNMLGPDIELLTEIMHELGLKHIRYGVKPEMFPIMGDALVHTLETTLKSDFTESVKEAWIEVYSALSQDMIRAQLQAKKRGKE
jgi:hemoglobin-like flavoprotein